MLDPLQHVHILQVSPQLGGLQIYSVARCSAMCTFWEQSTKISIYNHPCYLDILPD